MITHEEKALGEWLKTHLSHQDWQCITRILTKEDDTYVLSALKKDPKSFKIKHIKSEMDKLAKNESLYHIAKRILPHSNITQQI